MAGGKIFTDVVVVGSTIIFNVVADPNGVLSAPEGSMALRGDAGNAGIYQNTDGATAWSQIGGVTASQLFNFASQTPISIALPQGTLSAADAINGTGHFDGIFVDESNRSDGSTVEGKFHEQNASTVIQAGAAAPAGAANLLPTLRTRPRFLLGVALPDTANLADVGLCIGLSGTAMMQVAATADALATDHVLFQMRGANVGRRDVFWQLSRANDPAGAAPTLLPTDQDPTVIGDDVLRYFELDFTTLGELVANIRDENFNVVWTSGTITTNLPDLDAGLHWGYFSSLKFGGSGNTPVWRFYIMTFQPQNNF